MFSMAMWREEGMSLGRTRGQLALALSIQSEQSSQKRNLTARADEASKPGRAKHLLSRTSASQTQTLGTRDSPGAMWRMQKG